jgi:hypothetical protein
MAHSGHATGAVECLLSGAKQTSLITIPMSANDPKPTFSGKSGVGSVANASWMIG